MRGCLSFFSEIIGKGGGLSFFSEIIGKGGGKRPPFSFKEREELTSFFFFGGERKGTKNGICSLGCSKKPIGEYFPKKMISRLHLLDSSHSFDVM